jgi:hypothetical protein
VEAREKVLQAHPETGESQGGQPRARLPRRDRRRTVHHRLCRRESGLRAARDEHTLRVPNTNFYRASETGDDYAAFGRWAADRIAEAIEFEGPDTVAAVFLEPLQNTGGCFPPPPGYFQGVREICDTGLRRSARCRTR